MSGCAEYQIPDGGTVRVRVCLAGPRGATGPAGGQEVFIDSQPSINYPAISFTQSATYPGLYLESVNVP